MTPNSVPTFSKAASARSSSARFKALEICTRMRAVPSGTTGNPTIGAYTKEDVRVFGEVVARSFAAGGIAPGDMFQVAWGYGLFTGGLGGHGGCETLGACAIPASSGNTAPGITGTSVRPAISSSLSV